MLEETISVWNGVSAYGMERLWQASVTGSLYLLLIWAVCRLLRIPSSARAWLWWLACLKLLLG